MNAFLQTSVAVAVFRYGFKTSWALAAAVGASVYLVATVKPFKWQQATSAGDATTGELPASGSTLGRAPGVGQHLNTLDNPIAQADRGNVGSSFVSEYFDN